MNVIKIFNQLYQQYGPQHWWPRTFPKGALSQLSIRGPETSAASIDKSQLFEICLGAILTQNTAWKNVEKALQCLLKAKLTSPQAILKCPLAKLQKCIRSSGYYKQKAKKLRIFSQWLVKKYGGDLKKFFRRPLKQARGELLSLWGIGPETADSILLYAGKKPVFVIDAYTKRLCKKHRVEFKTYDEYQKFFEMGIETNKTNLSVIYNEYHALIVRWGKERG